MNKGQGINARIMEFIRTFCLLMKGTINLGPLFQEICHRKPKLCIFIVIIDNRKKEILWKICPL